MCKFHLLEKIIQKTIAENDFFLISLIEQISQKRCLIKCDPFVFQAKTDKAIIFKGNIVSAKCFLSSAVQHLEDAGEFANNICGGALITFVSDCEAVFGLH